MRRRPSVFTGASSGSALTAARRVELVQLDPPVAVRGAHRGDGGSDAIEPDEAVDRLALDDRLALRLQAEVDEERFDRLEVVDDKEHVVHTQNGHRPTIGRAGGEIHKARRFGGPCPVCGPLSVDELEWGDAPLVRQLHAGRVERAVAARILVQVLLVIVLGVVERSGRDDLGRDRAVALR